MCDSIYTSTKKIMIYSILIINLFLTFKNGNFRTNQRTN